MSLVNSIIPHRLSEAVAADGVSIAYEDIGYGDPLMLLHGLTESRESWHEAGYVEQFLQRERRLILVDCRGHGRSGKPHDPAAYSGRRRAADIIAVLDHAGIRRAALMGHSMGGVIALATAAYHPDRVVALIVNGAHPFAEDLTPLRAALEDNSEAWLAFVKQLAPDISPDSCRRIRGNDLAAVQASLARDRPDFSAAFAELGIPVLAISGTLDPRCDAARKFAELANGEFLPLEGKNHVTAFLDVETVGPVVDEFLGCVGNRNSGRGG
ncbi:MAG: alpha/beta hydrolase [Mesorhizobium sp.]|uniref:alpha/beta fold hydrolase n=1 Tax=Mesorhizobium sp. TaxID=1871066 RepID=UPI000FE74E22|nr:alpha/beta hydrolase [Mesorhizobium sp.]RWH73154.1 MAG: alpha/beta hydrolase [Mesorhizobium sp.]RWH73822.1 MAG: alpha/beta hydrolase [Mesorhizobium sp.]RWH86309.1 MAG: alpha/beta hydrolase [Mesorhizobium sp.]RWH90036.1 MAG: alpha/beta hydrolase [Mesorhizobium sp.]RWH97962.1 MAG: alpha/beta hydrolase [Mesorhizobium sp.]